jgi:Fic family protein
MDDFVNTINRAWDQTDPVVLATYVLWRINNIHPFINGNGRTARAACYFTLCLRLEKLLPGTTTLPELIRRERDDYCAALQLAHDSFAAGALDLSVLHALISKLLDEQLQSAQSQPQQPHQPILLPPAVANIPATAGTPDAGEQPQSS